MKTFLFLLVLIVFVVCITQKTNNKPGEDTNYPLRMMIIENHLTGEIDTFWFDDTDTLDRNYYMIENKSGELLKIQIEVDELDTLKFENN